MWSFILFIAGLATAIVAIVMAWRGLQPTTAVETTNFIGWALVPTIEEQTVIEDGKPQKRYRTIAKAVSETRKPETKEINVEPSFKEIVLNCLVLALAILYVIYCIIVLNTWRQALSGKKITKPVKFLDDKLKDVMKVCGGVLLGFLGSTAVGIHPPTKPNRTVLAIDPPSIDFESQWRAIAPTDFRHRAPEAEPIRRMPPKPKPDEPMPDEPQPAPKKTT
jgi:hypothetical protein